MLVYIYIFKYMVKVAQVALELWQANTHIHKIQLNIYKTSGLT